MFRVDSLEEGERREETNNVLNYDDDGGSKLRFIGEIGLEANTKYYKSWMDKKSAFWELDGLRHVFVPYVNYNYTTTPSEDRDHLYFFDDVDRIRGQHFVRLGMRNRLQTRRGDYGTQNIINWMEAETYVDYDFKPMKGFENLSNIGTILRFNPSQELSMSAEMLVDASSDQKGLKRFTPSATYKFTDEWKLSGGYVFQNEYSERALESMGSTLTKVVAGNDFERDYSDSHSFNTWLDFPIFEKAYGQLGLQYDIERGYFRRKTLRVVRNLHCWELALEWEQETHRSSSRDKDDSGSLSYTMTLATMPEDPIEPLGGDVSKRTRNY